MAQPALDDALNFGVAVGGQHLPSATWRTRKDHRHPRRPGIGSTELMHIFISESGPAFAPGSTGRAVANMKQPCSTPTVAARRRRRPPCDPGPDRLRYTSMTRGNKADYVHGWNLTGDAPTVRMPTAIIGGARSADMIQLGLQHRRARSRKRPPRPPRRRRVRSDQCCPGRSKVKAFVVFDNEALISNSRISSNQQLPLQISSRQPGSWWRFSSGDGETQAGGVAKPLLLRAIQTRSPGRRRSCRLPRLAEGLADRRPCAFTARRVFSIFIASTTRSAGRPRPCRPPLTSRRVSRPASAQVGTVTGRGDFLDHMVGKFGDMTAPPAPRPMRPRWSHVSRRPFASARRPRAAARPCPTTSNGSPGAQSPITSISSPIDADLRAVLIRANHFDSLACPTGHARPICVRREIGSPSCPSISAARVGVRSIGYDSWRQVGEHAPRWRARPANLRDIPRR